MRIGAMACYIVALIFYIISIILVIKKEKAACLIRGFRTLPEKEKSKYDTARMVLDIRANTQVWATLFLFGGVMCNSINQWFAVVIFIIWLYLLFKVIRSNTKNLFEKYKRHN